MVNKPPTGALAEGERNMSQVYFWAKSSETPTADRPAIFKSVAHHCADVAATALMLQRLNPARTRRDGGVTGLPPGDHAVLSALFAGLHDIGKIS